MKLTYESVIARIEASNDARLAKNGFCQMLIAKRPERCKNKAKIECPDCGQQYCRKCANVTICCPVAVGQRNDLVELQ